MSRVPPTISVLMATRDYGEFIGRAIESVLEQDYPNFELLVGDNDSADDTARIVASYARADDRVRYARSTEVLSLPESFNACARRMHPASRYFAFLPADDWWQPHALSTLLRAFERDPGLAFAHADGDRVDRDGRFLFRYMGQFEFEPPPGPHRDVRELMRNNFVHAQATLVNRDAFARLYPRPDPLDADLTYTCDYHLWLQLLARGERAMYVPERLTFYRLHAASHTTDANVEHRLREEATILEEKLPGACPPELDAERRRQLANRLKARAFLLLKRGRVAEARGLLRRAARHWPAWQLDRFAAGALLTLPLPAVVHAAAWRAAEPVGRAVRRP